MRSLQIKGVEQGCETGMYHNFPFILLAMFVFVMLLMALLALGCALKLIRTSLTAARLK